MKHCDKERPKRTKEFGSEPKRTRQNGRTSTPFASLQTFFCEAVMGAIAMPKHASVACRGSGGQRPPRQKHTIIPNSLFQLIPNFSSCHFPASIGRGEVFPHRQQSWLARDRVSPLRPSMFRGRLWRFVFVEFGFRSRIRLQAAGAIYARLSAA